MKKIYLSGQSSFGNRGCEAIVRSTVELLRIQFEDIEILVPSSNSEIDAKQWPESKELNVTFVRAYQPLHLRLWVHLLRTPIPFLKKLAWPFPMPTWLKSQLDSVDAVISIGGDNYSLDYRIPSFITAIDKLAMDRGIPVFLWGASVGPFDNEPAFVSTITKHLSRMTRIFVRESVSFKYLTKQLRLTNVELSADPAFALSPEPIKCDSFWPEDLGNGVLGFNISPLIEKYRKDGRDLRTESTEFIRQAVENEGFSVLLIPHVIPLDNSLYNNDRDYLKGILDELTDLDDRVKITPVGLNASQIKFVISKLRFFIGARTHSTIAALSSGIPTASIAYSVKARGINNDLFNHEHLVLNTPELSCETLNETLQMLLQEEMNVKSAIAARVPLLVGMIKKSIAQLYSMGSGGTIANE